MGNLEVLVRFMGKIEATFQGCKFSVNGSVAGFVFQPLVNISSNEVGRDVDGSQMAKEWRQMQFPARFNIRQGLFTIDFVITNQAVKQVSDGYFFQLGV